MFGQMMDEFPFPEGGLKKEPPVSDAKSRQVGIDLNAPGALVSEDLVDESLEARMGQARQEYAEEMRKAENLRNVDDIRRGGEAAGQHMSAAIRALSELDMQFRQAVEELRLQESNTAKLALNKLPHGYPAEGCCYTHMGKKLEEVCVALERQIEALAKLQVSFTLARRGYGAAIQDAIRHLE